MESCGAGEIKRKDWGLNGTPSPYTSDREILMCVREGWREREREREMQKERR